MGTGWRADVDVALAARNGGVRNWRSRRRLDDWANAYCREADALWAALAIRERGRRYGGAGLVVLPSRVGARHRLRSCGAQRARARRGIQEFVQGRNLAAGGNDLLERE